jgi:signal transduction histidine kinase
MIRFPPPIRYYVPLLVLAFGLAITWLDYEINLRNDLARNLKDVEAHTDATGERLARRSAKQFERGAPVALAEDVTAWSHQPWLKEAALVDENGIVFEDSQKLWSGHAASQTTLAPAMELAANTHGNTASHQSHSADGTMLYGAYPFSMGARGTGWALLVFDRGDAMAQALADANRQLGVAAAGSSLMCLCLWAALHFGFTARLVRLTQRVRDFGEGRSDRWEAMTGGYEVQELSTAFAKMVVRLGERDAERLRLEREILETTERERRRIGQDLHDGLGQQLTAASLAASGLISALESEFPALVPRMENLGRQIRESIAEVRALSHGLAPVALQEEGLMHALHELAEATSRNTAVRCVFECLQPVRVPDEALASHLYHIAQEAVNNALKHAAPHEIRIALEQRDGKLALEVDDDGEGLPEPMAGSHSPSQQHPSTDCAGIGIGIGVMRHRAKLLGATLEIGSPPAGGTRITCIVPLSR